MSFDIIIPARYASTRLPGKPLLSLGGKTIIEHVYRAAKASQAEQVWVATDDQRILDAVKAFGGQAVMTAVDHLSGTDRLAEVIQKMKLPSDRIVINVQGDEPFVPLKLINAVAENLAQHEGAVMATACHLITRQEDALDPNVVKVVMDNAAHAMFFSRSPIPYPRNADTTRYYKHIGIYAYRAGFVAQYNELAPHYLEQSESLEQLRVLANGFKISVETIDYDSGFGIDTKQDLKRARDYLREGKKA